MAHLTISVPRDRVDELRRHLLHAHARQARALRDALDGYLVSHERLDDVHGALVELTDLDEAIGQLGWTATRPPRAVTLSAHPEVLADAARAAGWSDIVDGTESGSR
jgi:hypothetical protein